MLNSPTASAADTTKSEDSNDDTEKKNTNDDEAADDDGGAGAQVLQVIVSRIRDQQTRLCRTSVLMIQSGRAAQQLLSFPWEFKKMPPAGDTWIYTIPGPTATEPAVCVRADVCPLPWRAMLPQ